MTELAYIALTAAKPIFAGVAVQLLAVAAIAVVILRWVFTLRWRSWHAPLAIHPIDGCGWFRAHIAWSFGSASACRAMAASLGVLSSNQARLGRQRVITPI